MQNQIRFKLNSNGYSVHLGGKFVPISQDGEVRDFLTLLHNVTRNYPQEEVKSTPGFASNKLVEVNSCRCGHGQARHSQVHISDKGLKIAGFPCLLASCSCTNFTQTKGGKVA